MNSEIINSFDDRRPEFQPYGLTCELWKPRVMRRPDRHNEIEINFFPEGTMTYLIKDKMITVPPRRLSIFWGLISHQIVHYEQTTPYFVCTIPFSTFLEWGFPASFVERIFQGEVLCEPSDEFSFFDEFILKQWIKDINDHALFEAPLLEMQARLIRLANNILSKTERKYSPIQQTELSQVERIAIYIAQNYRHHITVFDIGKAVGLHPDYANAIFKKAFGRTLTQYITEERILCAQRELLTTEKSITDIAYDCGFNSISRFNAAFMKMNRCTPRYYRKNYR